MPTTKPTTKPATMPTADLVWIELPKPINAEHAARIVDKANTMLQRLQGREPALVFSWNDKRKCYEYGDAMGTQILVDRGMWFSLEYMGRPI